MPAVLGDVAPATGLDVVVLLVPALCVEPVVSPTAGVRDTALEDEVTEPATDVFDFDDPRPARISVTTPECGVLMSDP